MKIIISPSKTQRLSRSKFLSDKNIIFLSEHTKLLALLKKLSKENIKKIMKIDKNLLDNSYNNIENHANLDTFHAFESFNGLVFKGLEKEAYEMEEYKYIESHLFILDAFYGILEPGTLIKAYRLDMKMKIGVNLYDFWDIDSYFIDEPIINLASDEFSKMINHKKLLNIKFLQYKNNSYVNQATYSKQARGQFLNYMIKNKIEDLSKLKEYNKAGYTFNKELSNKENYVFTRTN